MLTVSHLTKRFGTKGAVNDISFSIATGEVVGFLGPNGAGKTTTMRMITGFLAPTTGSITVANHDSLTDAQIVRQRLGYLPENNPLYDTMRVYEYLVFVAEAKHLASTTSEVTRVVQACQLRDHVASLISELSKGFRQRVGLAAALLGNPEVLLLDEPTAGLDPNQAADIRKLIQTVGKTKTVLFSSHLLTEVQQICDRVIIINHGQIAAQGTVAELTAQSAATTTVTAEIDGSVQTVQQVLQQLTGVQHVEVLANQQYQLTVDGSQDIRRSIFQCCVDNHWVLTTLQQQQHSLEQVFRDLTK